MKWKFYLLVGQKFCAFFDYVLDRALGLILQIYMYLVSFISEILVISEELFSSSE